MEPTGELLKVEAKTRNAARRKNCRIYRDASWTAGKIGRYTLIGPNGQALRHDASLDECAKRLASMPSIKKSTGGAKA